MKKIINSLVMMSILFNILTVSISAQERLDTFCSSSETFVGKASYTYNDNDFKTEAYAYNHSLAKMSLRFAMSAFAKTDTGYGEQYKNAKDLLENIEFSNISWNSDYTTVPTVDSVGVIAGNKKVTFEDGDYTLIAVAVRGGNYGAEWGGNFKVGNGDLHEGFKIARDKTLDFLKGYISDNRITGNIKIWLTGYSRGAATANLTAAYLDEFPNTFGEGVNLQPKNIYTYCFATPAGVKNPSASELYNNIFSIVNRNDFVPMLAMEAWGYGRYGRTYYLPTEETNADYEELEKKMQVAYSGYVKDEYKKTEDSQVFTEYVMSISVPIPFFKLEFVPQGEQYPGPHKTMEDFLEEIADKLAENFKNPDEYASNGQQAMVVFGEKIIGEGKMPEFLSTFKAEILKRATVGNFMSEVNDSSVKTIYDFIKKIAVDSIDSSFATLGIEVDKTVSEIIASLFIEDFNTTRLATLIGNSAIIGEGHYPELYMAWLDTVDETEFTNKNKSYVITRGITVTLYGDVVKFDQPPIIKDERTLVPLRAIFEALGATVDWDGETQSVTSVKDDKTVKLTIGSNILYVNDTAVELDVPAQLINERTLVPVRAVAESFDCKVDWDGDTQTVIIAG